MKAVIFNADDFGAQQETNVAIIRGHVEGVLTSASLMVNESAAGEAVELARQHSSLAVGLHLTLSNGIAALTHEASPHIVDSRRRFRESPALAGIACFFHPFARREVRKEVRAQFEKFLATGLPCDHVNGHQHLHLHPVIWDAMTELCEEYGVKRVRIPYEEFLPKNRKRLAGRRMEWLFFRTLRRRSLRTLEGKGFTVPDRVYGHLETGRITEEYLLELLGRLEGATNEIYSHPGTPHSAPSPGDSAAVDAELAALISSRIRERISELTLDKTSYSRIGQTLKAS